MALKFAAFLACLAVMVAVVLAHDGHDHHAPAPAPAPSAAFGSSPSAVVGFLALMVSFVGVIAKRIWDQIFRPLKFQVLLISILYMGVCYFLAWFFFRGFFLCISFRRWCYYDMNFWSWSNFSLLTISIKNN